MKSKHSGTRSGISCSPVNLPRIQSIWRGGKLKSEMLWPPISPSRMRRLLNTKSGKNTVLNIKFTRRAESDLDAIFQYIAQDNPTNADRVIQRIVQAIAVLENFPLLGRDGQVEGTREFSIARLPYIAVYRIVDETELRVLTVIHTARQYPPSDA